MLHQQRIDHARQRIEEAEKVVRVNRALLGMFRSEAWKVHLEPLLKRRRDDYDRQIDDPSLTGERIKIAAAKRAEWREIIKLPDDAEKNLEEALKVQAAAEEELRSLEGR